MTDIGKYQKVIFSQVLTGRENLKGQLPVYPAALFMNVPRSGL
jgi:hypothetical protein